MEDNILTKSEDLLELLKMDAEQLNDASEETVNTVNTATESNISITTVPIAGTASTGSTSNDVAADIEPDVDEVDMDEYMARFEKIQSKQDSERQSIAKLMDHKHAGGPLLSMVIDCIANLHAQNEEMYSLLVDMNNIFGK